MTITEEGIFVSDEPFRGGEDLCNKYPSLSHCLMDQLQEHAKEVLIVDDATGRRWTGEQVREKLLNISTALIDKYDFKPNTMVCISSDHSDYSCLLALGVVCAGGIVSFSYPLDPYPEILYLGLKVEPKFFFCLENNLHIAGKLDSDLGHGVVGIVMDGEPDQHAPFKHFQHLLNYDYSKSNSANRVPVGFKDVSKQVCFIMMSSGTTGKPKAVPVLHTQCIQDTNFSKRNNRGLSFACPASLDYVSGRMTLLGAIGTGYTAIILDGLKPQILLPAIEKYKISSMSMGAAAFYELITYEHLDKYDISSVRVIFPMGAKIVYVDELKKFFDKHKHIVEVKQGYGTSEFGAGAMNAMTPAQYLVDNENCGLLTYGNKAKIVDTITGKLLGPKQVGMLHIFARNHFVGYYDEQLRKKQMKQSNKLVREGEETNDNTPSPFVRDSSIFDEDGFYITGDLAYFNEKEQLYIVGRQKEMMSCRGAKKVLPQELEEVIEGHEIVSKVCVLGIPNKRELTLHCPRAFIIPKSDYYQKDNQKKLLDSFKSSPSELEQSSEVLEHKGQHTLCTLESEFRRSVEKNLMEFVNQRVGYEKQLTGGIVLLDEIPVMRPSGKLNKTYLRSLTTDQVEIYGDRST